jgi:hypothetical protein
MIQLNCTNCRELLTIDDAFAGGVCRCRHCGTIQTVPKRLKDNGDAAASSGVLAQAAGGAKTAKSLYKKRSALNDAPSGTGLDDLAEIVASSGLSSGRLRSGSRPGAGQQPAPAAPRGDRKMILIVAAAGAIIAVLLGIIIVMAVRDKSAPADDATQNPNAQPAPAATPDAPPPPADNKISFNNDPKKPVPQFLSQTINEKSVVFLIDRGASSAADNRLDLLKTALLNFLRNGPADRRFQVIFWQVDPQPVQAYPADSLATATPENVAALQKFMDDIYSVGQTKAPINAAFRTGADAVLLVPIKPLLDDSFQKALLAARGSSRAKVYCLTLNQPALASQLRRIAETTRGAYKDVSIDDARNSLHR